MIIYILDNDAENFKWLEYKGDWFDFFYKLWDSKPLGEFNRKIECKAIRDRKGRILGDYPNFAVPAISEKAKNVLGGYFENLVEIFPLETGKLGKYFFMNITNVLDCLDEEKSDISYFSSGRIKEIKSYDFKKNLNYDSLRIFKLKNYERGKIFVSEETKNRIEKSSLVGFKFIAISKTD
mgnify:CR=1 FL=1